MNGISSSLKDEIKKTSESKKKEKFKFIVCIFCSNILVALLFWQNNSETPKILLTKKILHAHHQLMEIPMEALVPESSLKLAESPVTIVSKNKKVIATKAWLHEEVSKDSGLSHFKIEISNNDVVKISEGIEVGMIAVPFVEKKQQSIKRGSRYEVSI